MKNLGIKGGNGVSAHSDGSNRKKRLEHKAVNNLGGIKEEQECQKRPRNNHIHPFAKKVGDKYDKQSKGYRKDNGENKLPRDFAKSVNLHYQLVKNNRQGIKSKGQPPSRYFDRRKKNLLFQFTENFSHLKFTLFR